MLLLNPRRTRTNMKLLQLVWIFLLTLCGQSAVIKIQVKEDDDVILDCSFGRNIENGAFDWKKDVDKSNEEVFWYSDGQTDPGKEFRGRVSYFPDQLRFGNASIKITKAKTSDSGTYTCYHATVRKEVKSTVSLTVGASPEPTVRILAETKDWSLLRCIVRGAFPKPEVVWTDSDGKILDADEPKVTKREGNKFDTVLNITVTKTDHYTCVATQKTIHHQINSTTFVHLNGASPRPIVTANKTNNGVLLKCEVLGSSPEPVVEWWDNEGNVLPADKLPIKPQPGNKYDVILNVVVIKAGFYRCVATQKKINHQIYTETYVPGPGGASKPSVTNLGDTKDGVLLHCEVFGASPELQVSWKTKAGQDVSTKEPQKTETGGGYDVILQTTVTQTDFYRCVITEGKKDEVYSEIFVRGPDGMSRWIIGVVSFIVGALVVGAIMWLWKRNKNCAGVY